MKYGNSSKR